MNTPTDTRERLDKLRELRRLQAVKARQGLARFTSYADDPIGFVTGPLGGFLTLDQQAIAESVRDNRYTAVPSAHDVGKSYTAAALIAWWLSAHRPGEAFAVSTAPTFAQVRAILWREVGRAHRAGRLPGRVNQTEWWADDEIVGYGRKPADWDPAAFQGIHARYVLAVIDEACGVPKAMFDAVDSIATNEEARVLAIGNPDDPGSHFERVCRPGSGWNVIQLDGLASPNFTDEEVPDWLRPLLLSPTWVEERRQRWGEGSQLWESKVRGRFPEDADDALIPASWIRAAQERWLELAEADELTPVGVRPVLGVDVARGGGDATTIAVRHGRAVWIDYESYTVNDTMKIAGEAAMRGHTRRAGRIGVDVVGVGAGVFDRLAEQGLPAEPLNAGWRPTVVDEQGDPMFDVIRSQWWWDVRSLFDPEAIERTDEWLAIDPDDDDLAGQLTSLRWWATSRGRIHVESKDELAGRGIDSPDRADALMHTIARMPETGDAVETWEDRYSISPV